MEDTPDNITPIRADHLTRFKPGGVGNPGGKIGPKREAALAQKRMVERTVEQLYREHAVEVFEALLKLIRAKDIAPTARINAIKEYNSRALGSPTATTIIKSQAAQDQDDVDLSDLTDDILRQVVDRSKSN